MTDHRTVLASFDVFDTMLARRLGSPRSCFYSLGRILRQEGLVECSAERFAKLREDAERRAFHNHGGLDSKVRLEDIYRELGFTTSFPEPVLREMMRRELALEAEVLAPISQGSRMLDEARESGQKIAFVSDMYLDSGFIRERLVDSGLFREGDALYVSNEYAESKSSGKLYRTLLEREATSARSVTHCGNHEWSDVGSPKKQGIRARFFSEGNMNRYERTLDSQVFESEGLSAALAGASRLTRLSFPKAESDREAALREVSAGVAAPLLVGFCLWILRRVEALGIERVYFVSRDGQILQSVFQRLAKKLKPSCTSTYIYGSRQAWLLPSLTAVTETQVARVLPSKLDVRLTPRTALARLEIEPWEVSDSLAKIGIDSDGWDRPFRPPDLEALRDHVVKDRVLHELTLERAQQARQRMLRYLDQTGLTAHGKVALVDLATGATLHTALSAVLHTRGIEAPTSFYLALRRGCTSDYGLPEPYFCNESENVGFMRLPGVITFLESVCSGDHGSVIGYDAAEGEVRPVLTEESNHRVLAWGYQKVRETVEAFADQLLLDPSMLNVDGDIRPALESLLQQFWLDPSTAEAESWGSFPMEDGLGTHSFSLPLAEPYSVTDVLRLWRSVLRDGAPYRRRHWWHQAALTRTPWALRTTFGLGANVLHKARRTVLKRD